jgi:hypothetical protein
MLRSLRNDFFAALDHNLTLHSFRNDFFVASEFTPLS